MIQDDLIFDIGLHKGYDAEFYLSKGFRVVGLEAVPSLAESSMGRLAAWGDRFTIVNKALWTESQVEVSFYFNPEKEDWGSLYRGAAEKGVGQSVEISVPTTTLAELLDEYGVPRYLKCDIEAGDSIFVEQLLNDTRRPRFVSVEMNDGSEVRALEACGYEVGQIVNQWLNPLKRPPLPAREGKYVDAQFDGERSGLFGRELSLDRWKPLSQLDGIFEKWAQLSVLDSELAFGWLDIHVARVTDLG